MDLFFDPGRTNSLRDRTTGILSDLLSEVIERVRGKTGDDMLSVAEGLNVNRHNTLLHGIPLKDGVKDVCTAIKEHAASRKRKRISGPSESDSSNHGSDGESSSDNMKNGLCTVVDESSSDICEHYSQKEDNEEQSDEQNVASSSQANKQVSQSQEQSVSDNKCHQKVRFNNVVLKSQQIKPESEPCPLMADSTVKPPTKPSVRTSSRRAKLDAQKGAMKPPEPVAPPAPAPSPQPPPPQKKRTETKPKKKRKSMKDLHKKCNKQYIKLEEVMLTDVPLLLDADSDEDDKELVTLIKSECPKNWTVGKPRTPSFRKKYFCRICTLGEQQ